VMWTPSQFDVVSRRPEVLRCGPGCQRLAQTIDRKLVRPASAAGWQVE